ncbi:hypothetical protein C8Q77DRAFT_885129 [Trametes polyzona]|nr:hypothetical protein C8Q77DRAFT_885129 [Trametes polyzona]
MSRWKCPAFLQVPLVHVAALGPALQSCVGHAAVDAASSSPYAARGRGYPEPPSRLRAPPPSWTGPASGYASRAVSGSSRRARAIACLPSRDLTQSLPSGTGFLARVRIRARFGKQ